MTLPRRAVPLLNAGELPMACFDHLSSKADALSMVLP